MGAFLDLLTGGGSSIVGSAINGISQWFTGKANRKAQAQENAKDRAFNAEQAKLNRQWQENMFNLHESPQAQAQARAQAGLSPTDGISSQSVGNGSTASASSSSLPPIPAPNFGDAISQLPFLVQQYRQSKAQTQALQLDNDLKVQEYESKALDNYRKAFENGNLEDVFKREMRLIDAQTEDYIAGVNLKDINRKNLEIAYANAKDARDKGINPVVDEHNESQARTAQLQAQTATEDLLRGHRAAQYALQNSAQALANSIQLKYGEQLTQANLLDVQSRLREWLVSEHLRQQLIEADIDYRTIQTWVTAVQGMMTNYDLQALQALYGPTVSVSEAVQMWFTGHNTSGGFLSLNLGGSLHN